MDNTNFRDMPIIALLETPLHLLTEEEQIKLVAILRETRTNAAATRSRIKASSDKIAGKPRVSKNKPSFNMEDLFKPQ